MGTSGCADDRQTRSALELLISFTGGGKSLSAVFISALTFPSTLVCCLNGEDLLPLCLISSSHPPFAAWDGEDRQHALCWLSSSHPPFAAWEED